MRCGDGGACGDDDGCGLRREEELVARFHGSDDSNGSGCGYGGFNDDENSTVGGGAE